MNLDTENKMKKALEALEGRLTSIRAGRANPSMLNGIMVEYYGNPTPLNSIANITVPEARQLFIKPFDRSALKNIEKAINESNLGIAPSNNGEMVIITIPELNEDRRKEYVKRIKAAKLEKMPLDIISKNRMYIDSIIKNSFNNVNMMIQKNKTKTMQLVAKIDALSPLKTLSRGYSVAQNIDGKVIKSINDVSKNDKINLILTDGKVSAVVE